jgi:hypothetical protein
LKLLRLALAVSFVFSSTLAVAQNTAPQVMPSQPKNAAQSMAQAPAAASPQRTDGQRSATGGQTTPPGTEVGAATAAVSGTTLIVLASILGIILLAAANSDSSTNH